MDTTIHLEPDTTYLCISPGWRLRNDKARILVYKYNTEEAAWKVLPPVIGFALSLFDGDRNLRQIATIVSEAFDTDIESARNTVSRTVREFRECPDFCVNARDTL